MKLLDNDLLRQKIRQLHDQSGMTFQEVERITGVHFSQIYKIIEGKILHIRAEHLYLLCFAYNKSVDDLLNECGLPPLAKHQLYTDVPNPKIRHIIKLVNDDPKKYEKTINMFYDLILQQSEGQNK